MKRYLMLATLLAGTTPLQAEIALTCYQRTYTAAHLAEHPVQRVRAISLRPSEFESAPPLVTFDLSLVLKSSPEVFQGTAYCEKAGAGLNCGLEGDAGSFSVQPSNDGKILITTGRYGMSFEGSRDFVTIDGTRGDDREFLLSRVACN